MSSHNPFTEEGRTRLRNFWRRLIGYMILAFISSVLVGCGFFVLETRANMSPLQRLYLVQYFFGSIKAAISTKASSRYKLLTYQVVDSSGKARIGGVTDVEVHPVRDVEGRPIKNQSGYVFEWNVRSGGELIWRKLRVNDQDMTSILREHHYEGASFVWLLMPSILTGSIIFLVGAVGLILVDQRLNKKYEEGKLLRGTRLIQPEDYKFKGDSPGLGVPSFGSKKGWWRKDLNKEESLYWLRVPREEEAAHTTILGDSGTGKSQLLHMFLWQIAQRQPEEAVIIYDPAGEFVVSHYKPERGDIILNPLDERVPFWNPSAEVSLKTDREMIADSFFPGNDHQYQTHGASGFFLKASRGIFARLLEFNPTPAELVRWLMNDDEIDRRIDGTELVQLVYKEAPQQRGGVLGTLSEAGNKLKMLPQEDECQTKLLLTEWAQQRKGWIFITSTSDTREQLTPLHAIFLDLMMKRLMTCDPAWGRVNPCWVIVDEAHALGRMNALNTVLTEGRKFGLRMILGTQNRSQFRQHYGENASTMLSNSVLKILFRCNEPESARWVSELIGEDEREKTRISTTASVTDQGRDSLNYSPQTERRPAVSREEIMGLPKLHGFWKYQDTVVPFRFEARDWTARNRTARFVPRKAMFAEVIPPTIISEAPEAPEALNPQSALPTETTIIPPTETSRPYRFVQVVREAPKEDPRRDGKSQDGTNGPDREKDQRRLF
jgi:type IV secretion system coupling TraD/TrwB family protein